MASHESYYTLASNPPPRPQSFVSSEPGQAPPPPPKSNLARDDTRRKVTPQTPAYTSAPPLPLIPLQGMTASPRPQPPVPTSSHQSCNSIPTQIPTFPRQSQCEQAQPPPPEAHWLPETLLSKTTAELAPILQNAELLNSLAHSHPSYGASNAQLNSVIQANLDLAHQLSTLESQVQQSRSQSAQLLLQHTTLSTQWRRKQSEMDAALSPWGPRAMYQRLVSSIGEQEALIHAMQESFLEGSEDEFYAGGEGSGRASDKEVGEWIRRIREGTSMLEKRRETRARWDEGRVGGWR